jgi:hypothetical protein
LLGWEYDRAQRVISTGKSSNTNHKQLRNGGVIWNRELESENFMIKKYYYVRLNPYLINKAQ